MLQDQQGAIKTVVTESTSVLSHTTLIRRPEFDSHVKETVKADYLKREVLQAELWSKTKNCDHHLFVRELYFESLTGRLIFIGTWQQNESLWSREGNATPDSKICLTSLSCMCERQVWAARPDFTCRVKLKVESAPEVCEQFIHSQQFTLLLDTEPKHCSFLHLKGSKCRESSCFLLFFLLVCLLLSILLSVCGSVQINVLWMSTKTENIKDELAASSSNFNPSCLLHTVSRCHFLPEPNTVWCVTSAVMCYMWTPPAGVHMLQQPETPAGVSHALVWWWISQTSL